MPADIVVDAGYFAMKRRVVDCLIYPARKYSPIACIGNDCPKGIDRILQCHSNRCSHRYLVLLLGIEEKEFVARAPRAKAPSPKPQRQCNAPRRLIMINPF